MCASVWVCLLYTSLDNEINSPEVYNDPDLLRQKSDELSDLRFHQEELFAAWEKAMEMCIRDR